MVMLETLYILISILIYILVLIKKFESEIVNIGITNNFLIVITRISKIYYVNII